MKAQVLYCMILSLPFSASAQNLEDLTVLKDSRGIIQAIEFNDSDKNSELSAQDFMKQFLQVSKEDIFIKSKEKQRSPMYVDDHYDQFYKDVKVDKAGYNFHFKNGKLFYAHGHFVKLSNLNIKPKVNEKEAKDSFALYKKIPHSSISGFTSELMIKEISSMDSSAHLVYKINLKSDHTENDEIGFIEAQTGEVLFTEPIYTHSSTGRGGIDGRTVGHSHQEQVAIPFVLPPAIGNFSTRYSGSRLASTFDDGAATPSRFRLFDNTRSATIHTRNLEGRVDALTSIELRDNDNSWTSAEHNFLENDMALDVHWALQGIYDRLNTAHGINSFNDPITGAGFPINAHVRYGTTNNQRDNAGWNTVDNFLVFGNGAVIFRPVASVDVVRWSRKAAHFFA